jgi:exodeoxyribonuclease-5
MLINHLEQLFLKNIDYKPTNSQADLIKSFSKFILDRKSNNLFLLKGYAGTGKTTSVKALIKTLREIRMKSVLLAPTGRAAKVLSSYTSHPAYTIHKKIYRQKSAKDGMGEFVLDRNLHTNTFFIVDEASMISNDSAGISLFGSGRLLDDLIKFVYEGKNCKLILIGDTAQLPPVKMDLSPALDKVQLEGYGLTIYQAFLTEILRQTVESGILFNATEIRKKIDKPVIHFPKIVTKNYDDIELIKGNDVVERISDTYDKNGIESTVIVTRSNKRANQFNQGIRNQILWREEELTTGDYLMIVKNNYFWADEDEEIDFIANGDIAEVVDIKGREELYGYRFADVTLRFIDYDNVELDTKILLDTLYSNSASLSREENKELFFKVLEDYAEVKTKKQRYLKVRENPFFNALQVKFAYAVTCHKAQGGQWKTVFLDHGYLNEEMVDKEFYRWLYTAFTRPTSKLYLINFYKAFLNEDEMDF